MQNMRSRIQGMNLLDYFPVGGISKASKLSLMKAFNPKLIEEGANAFRQDAINYGAKLRMASEQKLAQSRMLAAKQAAKMRLKNEFMRSTPESRTLSRIRDYMASKGRNTKNYFGY